MAADQWLETLWHGRIFLKGRLGVSLFEAWPYKGERGFIPLRSMALWQGMYRSSKHGPVKVKGRLVYRSSKLGCRKSPAVNLEQEQQKRCKKNMTGREKGTPKEVHPFPPSENGILNAGYTGGGDVELLFAESF